MCVIIHQPKKGRQVTYDEFASSWQQNPHGFGLMYTVNWVVVTEKSMRMNDAFEKYFTAHNEYAGTTDFVLHFRYSTHWSIGIDNVHPFPCGGGKQLVHNGVLGYTSSKKWEEDFSDTRLLAKTLETINNSIWDWLESDVICDFVHSVCSWDKILVMDTDGSVHYFGADGVMSSDGKLWASNSSPFDWLHSHSNSRTLTAEDAEFYIDRDGFMEDWVFITNEQYCKKYGIPYDEADWR